MDISTMRKHVRNNKYQNIKSFIEDLNLIWSNCKQYNLEESEIYGRAERMEKVAKRLLASVFKKKNKKKMGQFLHRTNKMVNKTMNNEDDINWNQNNELNDGDSEEKTLKEKMKMCQIIKKLSIEQLIEVIKIVQRNCWNAIDVISQEKFRIKLEDLSSTVVTKIFHYFEEIKITEKLNNYI